MIRIAYCLLGGFVALLSYTLPTAPGTLLQASFLLLGALGLLYDRQEWSLPLLIGLASGLELFGTGRFGLVSWYVLCLYLAVRLAATVSAVSRPVKASLLSGLHLIAFAILTRTLLLSPTYVVLLVSVWLITVASISLPSRHNQSSRYEIA